jgi:hypothetical protein
MNRFACDECFAIARELTETFQEAWFSSDQNFRDAWFARNNLIGGTEDDVLRAEALFPQARLNGSPKIGIAIGKKLIHEALTGHRVPGAGDY